MRERRGPRRDDGKERFWRKQVEDFWASGLTIRAGAASIRFPNRRSTLGGVNCVAAIKRARRAADLGRRRSLHTRSRRPWLLSACDCCRCRSLVEFVRRLRE